MAIQSLAVFCGSKKGTNPLYTVHAAQLGKLMAENNIRVIYGGGSAGIMGTIADSAMEHGGSVTGIIPKIRNTRNAIAHGSPRLIFFKFF